MNSAEYNINVLATLEVIAREKPRLVILGSSLFLFPHPIREIANAVHAVGGHLLFDASHVLGLIAGGAYPNPLKEGADFITSSTHKTFAGPQGGLFLTNDAALYERVAPAIYPALVTNHHLQRLPALWAVCEEWRLFGREHAAAIVENAKALGAALSAENLTMVGERQGYTTTHTLLIARPDAKNDAARLEQANILVTPVGLPKEVGGACLRLGVQEVTRRGMTTADAPSVASLIAAALKGVPAQEVAERVLKLVVPWNRWRFTADDREKSLCAS